MEAGHTRRLSDAVGDPACSVGHFLRRSVSTHDGNGRALGTAGVEARRFLTRVPGAVLRTRQLVVERLGRRRRVAQTEKNAAEALGGVAQSAREIFVENLRHDLLDWRGMLVAGAFFGIPALAMVILYRHPTARVVVLTITLALLIWDAAVAAAPHGGDRKGCTNCDGPGIAHLLADFFILTSSLFIAGVGWLRRLFVHRG